MFDIGWSEMLVVGVVALIVVGPKDLPKMFHTLGQITGKARGMAREFQGAMNAAAREAGVEDLTRDLRKVTDVTSGKGLKKQVTKAVGFDEIEEEFNALGGNRADVRKSPAARPMPGKPAADDIADEAAADEAEARSFSAVEAERLKRAREAAEARQKAARLRAQREADAEIEAQERRAQPARPATPDTAPASDPHPDPRPRDEDS